MCFHSWLVCSRTSIPILHTHTPFSPFYTHTHTHQPGISLVDMPYMCVCVCVRENITKITYEGKVFIVHVTANEV